MSLLTDVSAAYRLIDESDSHLGGHDLTNVGSVTFGAGKINDAASFNGVDNYLTVPITEGGDFTIGDNDFSFCFWVRWDASQVGVDESFIGTSNGDWIVTKKSNERLRFQVNEDSGGVLICEVTTSLNHSQWYFVVCEYSAADNELRMRIDDSDSLERIIDTTGNTPRDRTANFRMGSTNASNFLQCDIENVIIRKGSLWSAAEVTEMYNSGNGLDYFAFRDRWEVFLPLESDASDVRGHRFAQFTETGNPSFASGKVGNGAAFSGTSERYTSSDPVFKNIGAEDFCGSLWINPDTLANAGLMGQNNSSYSLQLLSSGKIRFRVDTTGGAEILDSTATVSAGVWTHIYWYHDFANNEIGISINNAAADTEATTARTEYNATTFTLASIATSNHYDGMLDQVRFVRGELLSTAERDADYNSGAGAAFSSELELDYATDSTSRRVKMQAKSTEIGGTGTQDCYHLVIDHSSLPDELHDSDETTTVEASGAGSLRVSTDEAGANMVPLKVKAFTPASAGGSVELWVNNGSTLDGTSGTDFYFWWLPSGHAKSQPPEDHVYGSQAVFPDSVVLALIDDDYTDATSNGNDGTATGVSISTDEPFGVGSFDFDGSTGRIEIPDDASLDLEDDIYAEISFKTDTDTGTFQGLFNKRLATSNNYSMAFEVTNNIGFNYFNASFKGATATFATYFSTGTWARVAGSMSYSSGSGLTATNLYHDAASIGSGSTTGQPTANGESFIVGNIENGSGVFNQFPFDGKLKALFIHNTIPSSDIRTTLDNNQAAPGTFWDSTFSVTSPGATGNNASGSIAQGGQSFSGSATVEVSASGALVQGGQVLSGSTEVEVSASGSITQSGQSLSGSITTDQAIDVAGALTQGGQALSGSISLEASISGGLVQGGQSISGTAGVSVSVSGALIQGAQTISGTVTGPISNAYATGETSVFSRATGTISINP